MTCPNGYTTAETGAIFLSIIIHIIHNNLFILTIPILFSSQVIARLEESVRRLLISSYLTPNEFVDDNLKNKSYLALMADVDPFHND